MNAMIASSMMTMLWGGTEAWMTTMVGLMLPTSMAPLEDSFENVGPMLPPLLVEGTLLDINGEGIEGQGGHGIDDSRR